MLDMWRKWETNHFLVKETYSVGAEAGLHYIEALCKERYGDEWRR